MKAVVSRLGIGMVNDWWRRKTAEAEVLGNRERKALTEADESPLTYRPCVQEQNSPEQMVSLRAMWLADTGRIQIRCLMPALNIPGGTAAAN
jgi:hypothetical protein